MEKPVWVLFALILSLGIFPYCLSAANPQQQQSKKKQTTSSAVFPIRGDVYPTGYYYAVLYIGNPPKPYYFDIDTGSDITWIQCDAPCVSCFEVPHPLYRPNKNSIVLRSDPVCTSVHQPNKHKRQNLNEQCGYEIEYADKVSSLGVLVRDVFPLHFTNGSLLGPSLAFGCGYDQQVTDPSPSPTDGTLGLGKKSSIVSQLHNAGLIKNVIGHCFSRQERGYLFFGSDLVPSSGVVWTPMSSGFQDKHYSPGVAELFFGKQSTNVKHLRITFDSGSTYTYFNSLAYQAFISSVKKDLIGKPLKEADDQTLPVCWKGTKRFKSIQDVNKYFKPATLVFSSGKKAQMELPPEAYLIISEYGNACLGILNGTEVGLRDANLVGDISLQDRLVIYDNEKQQIGWISRDCSKIPNVGHGEGLFEPYAVSMSVSTETYSATDEL